MPWGIHRREFQPFVCTHLGKQFQVRIYRFLADPKPNRTVRASFSDGYSRTGFESCWGSATRISTLMLSSRLTLTITSTELYPGVRGDDYCVIVNGCSYVDDGFRAKMYALRLWYSTSG
jgi:hypothetical protein